MSGRAGPDAVVPSRRQFLSRGVKWGAATTIGATIATLGYGFFNPQPNGSDEVRFPRAGCGDGDAGRRYLVAYASEFGSTGEVAEAIAATLCSNGAHAGTKRISDVNNLDVYDAVIIGAAIQFDSWMSEARDFLTDNETVLTKMPVAYFFTCLTLAEPSPDALAKANSYADKLTNLSDQVAPVSVGQFGGVLHYSRMSIPTLAASKVIYKLVGVARGDYRNWNDIAVWTATVHNNV